MPRGTRSPPPSTPRQHWMSKRTRGAARAQMRPQARRRPDQPQLRSRPAHGESSHWPGPSRTPSSRRSDRPRKRAPAAEDTLAPSLPLFLGALRISATGNTPVLSPLSRPALYAGTWQELIQLSGVPSSHRAQNLISKGLVKYWLTLIFLHPLHLTTCEMPQPVG